MTHFSQNLQTNKSKFDLVVFDVDGVLIDTVLSFPLAISKSIGHYGKLIGFPKWQEPGLSDVNLFKTFPGFNNEWDLDEGMLLFFLQEQILSKPANLQEFLKQSSQFDIGLAGIKKQIQHLSESDSKKIFSYYKPELLRNLAMEYYAGEEFCEFLYGFPPKYNISEGTLKTEKILIDILLLKKLSARMEFGIYTGRNVKEYELIHENIGSKYFNKKCVFCDDGSGNQLKPNPKPLKTMLELSGKDSLIFVGDSFDDFKTIQNFQNEFSKIKSECVQVLENKEPFHKDISTVESVNQLLQFLAQE
jgi:phosphoglycolate phosphatase-like HAD superfamily hydrolase